MLEIPVLTEQITLNSKRDVLHLHLYTKFKEKNIVATSSELEVLMELYEFGGYDSKDKEKNFFHRCIEKKHRRTIQSVKNVLSTFTKNGVINRPKLHHRSINEDFLPVVNADVVGLNYRIINAPI